VAAAGRVEVLRALYVKDTRMALNDRLSSGTKLSLGAVLRR
jgi:hypothetical protein